MNDGLLEVLLVKKPRSLADLQGVVAALLLNDLSNPCLYSFHASDLRVFSSEEVSWTLDGEFGGNLCDVRIEVAPQAYRIMVPAKEEKRSRNKEEAVEKLIKTDLTGQDSLFC